MYKQPNASFENPTAGESKTAYHEDINTGKRSCSAVPTASTGTAAAAALVLWCVCNCAGFLWLLLAAVIHHSLLRVFCLFFVWARSWDYTRTTVVYTNTGEKSCSALLRCASAAAALVPWCVCNCAAFLSCCWLLPSSIMPCVFFVSCVKRWLWELCHQTNEWLCYKLMLLSETRQRKKARKHHSKTTTRAKDSCSAVLTAAATAAVLVLWCACN